jgi:hypothetical protein
MSGTRSLGPLLLLSVIFCAGVALAVSATGFSALATRTQPKLKPPTVLWNAYPLRQAHTNTTQAANKKPITTEARSTAARGNRSANRPTSSPGGFPTIFVMTGVIGALLASTLLFVAHAAPGRAGGYRRVPRPSKPPARTGRSARPSLGRTKRSREKQPPPAQPPEVESRVEPVVSPEPVEQSSAAPSPPAERETTDDLLEALRPNIEPAEEPEEVSALEVMPRAMKLVEADLHPSAVKQALPQRAKVAGDLFGEIRLWRGYVKCQLYIEVEGSPGAFRESSLFRLRDPMVPDDRAEKALADLLADLERAGWLVVETGPAWYRRRLKRSMLT